MSLCVQVVRKFVIAGLCSCEELADALLHSSVNRCLVDVGQQPFGKKSSGALKAWAKRRLLQKAEESTVWTTQAF